MRWGWLAIALLGALVRTSAHAAPIAKSVAVAVHLYVPSGSLPSGGRTRVLEALRPGLERRTSLSLAPAASLGLNPLELEACNEAGSLACWVRASHPSTDEVANAAPIDYLLAISVRPAREGRIHVSLLFLPTSRAERYTVLKSQPDDPKLEEALFAASVALDRELALEDEVAWSKLSNEFAEALQAKHLTGPEFGDLVVRAPAPSLSVALDGETVGALDSAGRFEIDHLVPGNYRLALEDPRRAIVHRPVSVAVRTGTVTVVSATLEPAPLRSRTPLIGGLSMAAVGVALAIYGAAAPANYSLCTDSCGRFHFTTFGEGSSLGSGVMIAPLGYSLALSGIGWSVSSLVLPDGDAATWLGLGISLVLGVVSYAISAAVGG